MTSFDVRDGQFWCDDAPQLLQAGELHYFRTPRPAWRQRLELLQRAGFNAVAAYIPWLWHQPAEGACDFDGRTHPLRDLSGFLDLAAEMGFFIIARPGPYIMAETINEGIPPWVFARYPQCAAVDRGGAVQNIAAYLHPDFLACAQQWYRDVFHVLAPRQITRGGRIVMVQLDNEMGMLQWVRNLFDVNPDTLGRLAAYLRQTYGDNLTARYPAADLAAFLRDALQHGAGPQAARVVEDYRRFYRGYLKEYAAFLLATAVEHGLETLPVINIHGFANGGKTFPLGLSQLADALRLDGVIGATDVYPLAINEGNFHQLLLVNEMTKALHNPQQALFSIEFQAGGNNDFGSGQTSLYDLHSRLCLSVGMRAINHYLFFDGENHPLLSPTKRHDWGHPVRKDGTLRRHYHRYPRLSQVLSAYGRDLILAAPETTTTIGFLLDQYLTELSSEATRAAVAELTHQRDVIQFDLIARGLALTQRPFAALELSRHDLDPAQTPTCWVMLDRQCPAEVQRKLVEYVRRGGRLVLIGRLCSEEFDHTPCAILAEALGVAQIAGGAPFVSQPVQLFGQWEIPAAFVETYRGDFAEIIATGPDGVVGFVQTIGRGQAVVLGCAFAINALDDLAAFDRLAHLVGCAPLFACSDWVDVRSSRGEHGSFLYIQNYQDDPVETTLRYRGAALFGGCALRLPARRGVILPLGWRCRDGVLVDYATAEITAVVEDAETLTLRLEPAEFDAELVVDGAPLCVRGTTGEIVLRRRPMPVTPENAP